MARQSLDPSPEVLAPSAGETSLPNDPARSTWRIQLSILDFPVQVDSGACSWSKGHSPYGPPAISAKRAATQLQPNPRRIWQSICPAAGADADRRSRPAPFEIARF